VHRRWSELANWILHFCAQFNNENRLNSNMLPFPIPYVTNLFERKLTTTVGNSFINFVYLHHMSRSVCARVSAYSISYCGDVDVHRYGKIVMKLWIGKIISWNWKCCDIDETFIQIFSILMPFTIHWMRTRIENEVACNG
jgi:hypothetical protein